MTNKDELKKIKLRFEGYLPDFALNAPILKDIFLSQIHESYYLQDYIKRAIRELTISTATEVSIDSWEKLAGLNNKHLDIKNRIDLVIKKFSLKTHANHFNFTNLLKEYDSTIKVDEIIDDYRLDIKMYRFIGYLKFLSLIDTIDNYKPAHIGYNLEINRHINKNIFIGTAVNKTKKLNIKVSPNISQKTKTYMYMHPAINAIKEQTITITPITNNRANIKNNINIGINRSKKIKIDVKPNNYFGAKINVGMAINQIKTIKINI